MKTKGNRFRGSVVLMVAFTGVLSSCSHKVVPPDSGSAPKQDSAIQAAALPLQPVYIDTVVMPLDVRPSAIETFWRAEVIAKRAALYKTSGYRTVWFLDHGPSPLFEAALRLLSDAGAHGLEPTNYVDLQLEERVRELYKQGADARTIGELDIAFTDKVLLFTTHVSEGRVVSVANGKSVWKRPATSTSTLDVQLLGNVTTPDELRAAIKRIQPQNDQYVRLQKALAFYRSIEKFESQPISVASPVKPGERSAALPLVRKRLSYLNGSLLQSDSSDQAVVLNSQPLGDSLFYDASLAASVQLFQRRHGLTPDGVIGERTLRFMNQRISDRTAQIALNMDRLRWMPSINAERYLLVNLPDYKLTVYEGAQSVLEMRVIVGSAATPTPVFNDQLNHIVFSPTWTVPTSIIRNEIIPNLRKDSTYYSEKNFVIYKQDVQIDPALENWKDPNINPYQLRVVQNPGADNSLGSVKFIMPNNMSVYLHDTPSRRLFGKDYRALSHGCVRLHEPAKLAEYLLKDQQGWDTARIAKAMSGSSPATILLKKRTPVFLTYQTAWVDNEGLLQFREDIYGHDKIQMKQLQPVKPVPVTTVSVSAAGM
jgi:murein L,D-transpeptidase YcbB/YkuD